MVVRAKVTGSQTYIVSSKRMIQKVLWPSLDQKMTFDVIVIEKKCLFPLLLIVQVQETKSILEKALQDFNEICYVSKVYVLIKEPR